MTMSDAHFLPVAPFTHAALDYERLRQEGLAHLEQLAGLAWTDFNDHDPGITILEQLCYALTDLAYRLDYEIPDLLARTDGEVGVDFHPPEAMLPNAAVTLDDLRRLVIDVVGVRNAWVLPAAGSPPIYYDELAKGISLTPPQDNATAIALRGLLQVRYEYDAAAQVDGRALTVAEVTAAVTHVLHAQRPLGVDFLPVQPLSPENIEVVARIEIGLVDDARAMLADLAQCLADYISPAPRFTPYAVALQQGIPLETLLTGPLLHHGYLDPAELARAPKRELLHTSDLLREMMALPGVEAVTSLEISAGGPYAAWTLPLNAELAPRLDVANSRLTLVRRGQLVSSGSLAGLAERAGAKTPAGPPLETLLATPAGRDRHLGQYRSLMHQFPDLYGVNAAGLPATAPPARQAQALQLKGYLLFFDQLLAILFAQLDHVRKLLAVQPLTGFATAAQPVIDAELALHELYHSQGPALAQLLAQLTESSVPAGELRARQLDHLLARCGESLTEYALAMTGITASGQAALQRQLVADRQAFLAALPRLAARRGSGLNLLLEAPAQSTAGLAERLQRKLGLSEAEPLLLIEHILLRPGPEDEPQRVPLIIPANGPDPYSLQLSLVLSLGEGRAEQVEFRTYVERLARQECPAHLAIHVHWLAPAVFAQWRLAYAGWLAAQRTLRLAALETAV
ncbi:MAG: hypothetical protein KDE09_10415 [Anaerolineales bacterium]|nr:hypothetical protein [Anaerolineales bacterium]